MRREGSLADAGFRELEHTADWALEVWAPDLEGLFVQAARGILSLSGIRLDLDQPAHITLQLTSADHEELLVCFLDELLFLAESHEVGFDRFHLQISDSTLEASLSGGKIVSQDKEIKAVTYHNLKITKSGFHFRTSIVFDV